jgi:3-oxoacyl-[acyl-carrier-protein] synthase III
MSVADAFIKAGTYKNILVVGAEIHSFGLDFSDEGRGVSVILEMEQVQLFYLLQKTKTKKEF